MFRACTGIAALCLVLEGPCAWAQSEPSGRPNSVLLIAKRSVRDPNFAQTVVLVTRTPEGGAVGVILNRPTPRSLSEFMPDLPNVSAYADALYGGGPVMRRVIVALFEATAPPAAPAFRVLDDVYLSMHHENIGRLLGRTTRYRLYAGFSGWAPRQLETELAHGGWHVVPADADVLFRADTAGLWQELIQRAESVRADGRRNRREPSWSGSMARASVGG